MKGIYKICGPLGLLFYFYFMYRLWHMCQYGGLRSHLPGILIGVVGFVVLFIFWLINVKKLRKRILIALILVFLSLNIYFGGRILYSAIPYNGQVSWKIDEWRRKKEVALAHNNVFESGIEGILEDLDEALSLPDELYISNEFRVRFDRDGTIQSIHTFIYGQNNAGEKKTYLVDYSADSLSVSPDSATDSGSFSAESGLMTVWTDGQTNGEYEEEMLLSPMLKILQNAGWVSQVQTWALETEEDQIYELLYFGKRSFSSPEGLIFLEGDVDGDGVENGADSMQKFMYSGGEVMGFEVSLSIPALNKVTPVRYIMEPEYVNRGELEAERISKIVT